MNATIRELLKSTGRLAVDVDALCDTDDLHNAGLTSFATVELMMTLEDKFGIEYPDRMMNRRHFATIAAIEGAVRQLVGPDAVAA